MKHTIAAYLVAHVAGALGWLLWLFAFALIAGCPIRVDPPTAEVCPSRPNCGRCAATAPCAWCPSTDPALRACIARDMVDDCDAVAVITVERCPEDATGELP